MSFIFDDKKLLQKLLEAGEDTSLKKRAQTVNQNATAAQTLAIYQLAKKLALNLKSTIEPGTIKKDAPVDFEAAQAPEIRPENLETLGDFLTWASTNGVKWDGKRIAWANKAQAPEDAWLFQSYRIDRARDPDTRQAITENYYVDKDALIKFLTYLRDSETAKTNKVFEIMIGKVITQANQFLQKQEQIVSRPAAVPVSKFEDSEVIDGFMNNILDPKDPYAGIQNFAPGFAASPLKLTYGDIKDFGSLQSWLGGMLGADHKNPNDPGANPCPSIHVLYLRAKYLAGRADLDKLRPNYSTLAKSYLQNIVNFGKQFSFNGQSCDVIGPTAGHQTGDMTGEETATSNVDGGGSDIAGDINTLKYLAIDGPFNSNDISFDRITAWVNRYAQYQPQVQSSVAVILRIIQEIKMHMTSPGNSIPTGNLTYDTVSMISDAPRVFADHLWSIVYYTGTLYQSFFSENGKAIQALPNGEQLYRAVQQQITGASPYADNMRVINELRADVRENIVKNTKR